MNGSGDEYDEMIDGPGFRGEAGGRAVAGDEDVTRFLMELRALGDVAPPEPSPELAALLGGATPIPDRRAVVRAVLRTAAVAALVAGVLVLAAAKHSLPSSAQRLVSNVVNVLTPFQIGSPSTSTTPIPPVPSDKPHLTSSPVPPPRSSTSPARTTNPVPVKVDDGGPGDDRASGAAGNGEAGNGDAGNGDDRQRGGSEPRDDRSEENAPSSPAQETERERGGGSDDGPERSSSTRPSPLPSQPGGDEPGDH